VATSIWARLYWPFWVITTMLTGVLSGYMVSHSIMFGQFFNWYIESDNLELLRQTYTTFRAGSDAYKIYDIPLLLHLIAGTVFVLLAFLLKRHRVITVLAGLSTAWVGAIFIGMDVGEAEDAVLTSTADSETVQYFLSINIPAHSSFAVIYLASLFLLLLIPLLELQKRA
jgi:hypothetical protein